MHGMALPVVLALVAMMLVISAASFELATIDGRRASNVEDHLFATQAANAALVRCADALESGGLVPILPAVAGEPTGWRRSSAFDGPHAFAPLPSWLGARRPPLCLIEPWRLARRPLAQAYLLTARGFGAREATEVWLQLAIVVEAGREQRHWRRVAARPS
ncbi:hypothetical protein D7S89_07715 [Trinickia fusca]|uniref:Pilus assembly protein n=2 Tax=Trinickia fusca TaxID=2419777 RepID=A0A494XJN5_9BURK|nr:hypothetical protein D7S89_07715 [Trinickia fusca]